MKACIVSNNILKPSLLTLKQYANVTIVIILTHQSCMGCLSCTVIVSVQFMATNYIP